MNIIKLGLSMALATAMAALIEESVTGQQFRTVMLIVALLAAVALGLSWTWARIWSARHGCFVHAVCEEDSRLARHIAEHEILRAWAGEKWPDSPVLPFRPVATSRDFVSGESELAAVSELADRVLAQIRVAQDFAPGITKTTILPAGAPHRMVALGAMLAPHIDPTNLRVLSDNATVDDQPFVEFRMPVNAEEPVREFTGTEPEGLFIPAISHDNSDVSRLAAAGWKVHALEGEGNLSNGHAIEDRLRLVRCDYQAFECAEMFTTTSGPAALAFASGYLAARMGFHVNTCAFDFKAKVNLTDIALRVPQTTIWPKPHRSWPRWLLWWVSLLSSATLLSVAVVVLAACVGLALEQRLLHITDFDWAVWWRWAGPAAIVTSLTWVWHRWTVVALPIRLTNLLGPRLTIAVGGAGKSTLRSRRTAVRDSSSEHPAQDRARNIAATITDTFCAAIDTLPSASKWTVQLDDESPWKEAKDVLTDGGYGLDRTLRARSLVDVVYKGHEEQAMPRGWEQANTVFKDDIAESDSSPEQPQDSV